MSQEGKGARKYGRNKRARNSAMSAYVRGKIDWNTYEKQIPKQVKPALPKPKKEGDEK